jgi:isocitrate dehydrogenase
LPAFDKLKLPDKGEIMRLENGKLRVAANPVMPFIRGDGVGPDIWGAAVEVFDAAVRKAYGGKRECVWFELYAGEQAQKEYGEVLPSDTVKAIRYCRVAIKGPLTTPVSGGYRSLNVTLRQQLDLYACVRPVRYIPGVPSPVLHPDKLDVVVFRENTEDVYAGLEWESGSEEARELVDFLSAKLSASVREGSAVGLKPVSEEASKRLVRKAIQYAIDRRRRSVTLIHKGNIMKYTEGAFRDWGYEVAADEFPDSTVAENDLGGGQVNGAGEGRIVIKDRIADSMFQQVLLRPEEYDVLATTNLNGDYISDACAAQIGGLGLAPGANIGDGMAIFEATHGTAPKYAGQDKVNPSSLILSGAMMFDYMGWMEVSQIIEDALSKTVADKTVTYDLHRQMSGAALLKCSEFGRAVVDNMA